MMYNDMWLICGRKALYFYKMSDGSLINSFQLNQGGVDRTDIKLVLIAIAFDLILILTEL